MYLLHTISVDLDSLIFKELTDGPVLKECIYMQLHTPTVKTKFISKKLYDQDLKNQGWFIIANLVIGYN